MLLAAAACNYPKYVECYTRTKCSVVWWCTATANIPTRRVVLSTGNSFVAGGTSTALRCLLLIWDFKKVKSDLRFWSINIYLQVAGLHKHFI